jgi:hypothetical protein
MATSVRPLPVTTISKPRTIQEIVGILDAVDLASRSPVSGSAFACFAVVIRLVPWETRVWPTAANASPGKRDKFSYGDGLSAQHAQHVDRP